MGLEEKNVRVLYLNKNDYYNTKAKGVLYHAIGHGIYKPYDYAALLRDLEAGNEVRIRTATKDESAAIVKTGS